jgi:hypothetical protein
MAAVISLGIAFMPLTWAPDPILASAPDASSAKAGQGLATPRKWLSLGYDERAAWGECRGSASEPYRAQVGVVVKDSVQDRAVWLEYLETVVKERKGWKDL